MSEDHDNALDYDGIARLVARWRAYAGMVSFHMLPEPGLGAEA